MAFRFASVSGSGTACSQASPCSLATAVSQAAENDTVYVAAGTYAGSDPEVEVVAINTSISLLGGWDGAPTGPVVRDPALHASIIDGENARRGITMNAASTVDGFTIRHGAQVNNGAGLLVNTGTTGTAVISHNIFLDNIADWYGGGVALLAYATAVINDNQFTGNQSGGGSMNAYFGGALYGSGFNTIIANRNHFQTNQSSSGSAISAGNSAVTLSGNHFVGNNSSGATVDLGAYEPFGGSALVVNNLFQNNIRNHDLSISGDSFTPGTAQVLHNSFVGGPTIAAYAVYVLFDAQVTITNNIFAYNLANSIGLYQGGAISGARNLFWQNDSDPHLLVSPILADPAFLADGYHLGPASAAINAGIDVGISNDIDGEIRPQAGGFDVGADESPYEPPEPAQPGPTFTVNVTDDTDDAVCGLTHCSLPEAIRAANAQAGANTITFAVSSVILLNAPLPDITEDVTIIGPGSAQLTLDANGQNFRVLNMASGDLTISGLTIQNADFAGNGGGLFVLDDLQVSDVHFYQNRGSFGGAVLVYGTAVIHNSRFINNTATQNGGAIMAYGPLTVSQSHFVGNQAAVHGGAIAAADALVVRQSGLRQNGAGQHGGGVYLTGSQGGLLENSLLAQNSAAGQGSGFYTNASGGSQLVHVTVAAPGRVNGRAIYVQDGLLTLTNSIIANHATGLERAGGAVNENFNLFYDNGTDRVNVSAGANSLTGNPQFARPDRADYRLGTRSAAVDRGTNAGVLVDFEGHTRPLGGGFDIGYDEQVRRTVTGPGSLTFEDTGVQMDVTQTGDLDSISVVLVEDDHPNAAGPVGLGRYWMILGQTADGDDASGFTLDLTLPRGDAQDPTICRYDGQQWDCERDEFDEQTVTRRGVTTFSDWTVADGQPGYALYLPVVIRP